jgi:hypothetical protein
MNESGRDRRDDDVPRSETTKLPAAKPGAGAATKKRSERPPPRPTLSVEAAVAIGDVPVVLSEPQNLKDDDGLFRLFTAIDGDSTVAEVAERAKLELEHARALLADLRLRGHVNLTRRTPSESDVASIRGAKVEPRSPDYWLAGLKPRRR